MLVALNADPINALLPLDRAALPCDTKFAALISYPSISRVVFLPIVSTSSAAMRPVSSSLLKTDPKPARSGVGAAAPYRL